MVNFMPLPLNPPYGKTSYPLDKRRGWLKAEVAKPID
jgi:hypothetical protein